MVLPAVEIIDTSFETPEYMTGSINGQHAWSVSDGSSVIVQSEDSAATGFGSLNFSTSNTLKTLFVPYSSSEDGPTGVVYFDIRIRVDELTNKYFAISGYDLYNGSEKRAFVLEFNTPLNNKGVFQAYNGSSKVVIGDYYLKTWCRISGRIDYNHSSYQVIFNGIASDVLNFREPYTSTRVNGEKQFHQLRFNLGYDSATGTLNAFADDLYMGSDPINDVTFNEIMQTWTIDVQEPEFGSIILNPDLQVYEDSSWITARIELPDGYMLDHWTGDLNGSDSLQTFQITSNMIIGAAVLIDTLNPPQKYTITLVQPVAGTITLNPNLNYYYAYSNVTASIDVPSGYVFSEWTNDLSGTNKIKSFRVLDNMTIGATVVIDTIPPAVYTCSSAAEFKSKCTSTSLRPGDIIELTEGNYDTDGITVTAKGTAQKPIIIRSQNRSDANLSGGSFFTLKEAEYVIIEDFEFSSAVYTAIKLEACNNIVIRRNTFHLSESADSRGKWVLIGGAWDDATKLSHHNVIEYNLFEEKHRPGNYITIDGGSNVSQNDIIRYNYFKNIGPRIENEMEAIRIGVSGISLTDGFTLIEHNLFEGCDGDPEIISIKSCKDTVRYNTFIECQGTVCLRQGNGSVVDGNFFFGNGKAGTGGVRLYSRDHIIVNNYFQDLTGETWDAVITLTNGDIISGEKNAHWQIQNAKILNNTIVNTKAPFEIGYPGSDNSWGKVPVDCRIAGNIIFKSVNPPVVYKSIPGSFVWENNIYYDTVSIKSVENLNSSQIQIADPGIENSAGFYKPQNSGLAAAYLNTLNWPTDIQGLKRTLPSDAGAAETTASGLLKNRPLTASDVGPDATELVVVNTKKIDIPVDTPNAFNFTIYPNPFNPLTMIEIELFSDSDVKIDIFTLDGRFVRTLIKKYFKAGKHHVKWSPEKLAGGIYLIRTRINNSVRVQKALFLK